MYLTENQKIVLQELGDDEMTIEALMAKCLKRDKLQKNYHWKKVIERMEDKLIVVTEDATVYAMEQAKGYVDAPRPKKQRIERFKPAGDYDGKELSRTCHRPGAYTFMDVPSMRDGQRVPYRTHISLTTSIQKTWLGS